MNWTAFTARPLRRAPLCWLFSAVLMGAAHLVPAASAAGADESKPLAPGPTLRDPWVPPESRRPSASPPTQGVALRTQVERKLRQAFEAADVDHLGTLTQKQASAGGLGFVARHFAEIDRGKTGKVRFEDVKRYLVEHGAQLE
jgi:hypothetical protein